MLEGDKIIAIGKQECQDLLHDQLIGDPEAPRPADAARGRAFRAQVDAKNSQHS